MTGKDGLPLLECATREEWEAYLEEHHGDSRGVWLRFGKKGSGVPSPTYEEALEAALCFGWIDGQRVSFDERSWLQRFTPRSPRSRWSKLNRERAISLIEQGRMRPAGLREVEAAQRDGRWEAAYDPMSTAEVPDDLRRRLDEEPAAKVRFDALDSRNRYAILYRIQEAKRPETRARRIEQFVAMLREGRTIY